MSRATAIAFACLLTVASAAIAQPADRQSPPQLVVTGEAKVSARPNVAIVRLGATVQADEASAAQKRVNQIMQRTIAGIKDLDIASRDLRTIGLTLSPVYGRREAGNGYESPKIVGYRASNTVRVVVDDLEKVGKVIDAGVSAGANQVEGLSFELRDDTEQKAAALSQAVRHARTKAAAMAQALDVRIVGVLEVREQNVTFTPRNYTLAADAVRAATPVEPGEVSTEASVTVRYRIASTDLRDRGRSADDRDRDDDDDDDDDD